MTHLLNEERSNFFQKWYWGYHYCFNCNSEYCSWHKSPITGNISVICDACGHKDNDIDPENIEPIEVEDQEASN